MMRRHGGRLLLGAAVALVLLYLVLPVAIIVPMSFSASRFLTFPPPNLSLRWYRAFLGSFAWMQAARTSLTVAALTALLATPLGTAAAYGLHHLPRRLSRVVQGLLLLPLMVPIIVIAVGVFFVFARLHLLATLPGLVLADVMLGLPYVVTSVLAALRGFDPAQELAARSLGMGRPRSFLAVVLPQIRPAVISGALFAFITALDETIVALFVSGGRNQTLTKRMFTALRDEIDPTIAAISSLLTATSVLLLLLIVVIRRRQQERGEAPLSPD
jgi:putative spermidine/putrescine transport system permease protein